VQTSKRNAAVTIQEAAQLLGVSQDTIRRRIRADQYPNAFMAGSPRAWQIPLSELGEIDVEAGTPAVSGDPCEALRMRILQLERALGEARSLEAVVEAQREHISDLRKLLDLQR
jgi:excisionase family DNA binding protein